MSTRPTRSATVVEGVRATGSHSDRTAAPRGTKDTAAPFVSHAQQAPPSEAVGEFPVSGNIDEDTYFKLCDNLKTLKLGDSELSDSFEESIDHESDTTGTQDSDTGSFYSVQSHRTEKGANSFVSLFPLDSTSESTLYASAQSFQSDLPHSLPSQTVPSHDAVFREKRSPREHRSSLTFLPGHTQRFDQVYLSDPLEEYTSCPNLAPLEEYRLTPTAPVPCPAPALSGVTTRRTMSTVDGATSPKSPRSRREEDGEKKKKGLISSFRKSRKTGRKLRQQKKAAEGDTGSVSTGVNSDNDSEPSAPSSPAIVKSQAVGYHKDGEDTDEPTGALDSHERLNGSAAPKEEDPRSKTPSPTPKGTGVEEGNKKGEEKEEKKREKSKFGSFLRKEKKIKDSASKSSLASNASAASSQATDPSSQASADGVSTSDSAEHRQEEKEFKNDTEQATAVDDDVNLEPRDVNRRPSDAKEPPQSKTSPVQPRSSPVRIVKNLTVNTTIPKDKAAPGSKPKLDADADQGDVKGMESADVKKNVKPASTEVKSSRSSEVTSKQTEAYRLEQAFPLKPVKVVAPPSPVPTRKVVWPSGERRTSISSSRCMAPIPLPGRRYSLENISLLSDLNPVTTERPISLSSSHFVPPPLTFTSPKDGASHPSRGAVAVPAGRPVAIPDPGPAQVPITSSPPSSPEGHAKDSRETPEGDRSEGERNPLLDASSFKSDSWVW